MPTFEAITMTLMLATVGERIAEAMLEFLNAHIATIKSRYLVFKELRVLKTPREPRVYRAAKEITRVDRIVRTNDDKIEKEGGTKLVALIVNLVVGAFIVFVFDINLASLILDGVSQAPVGTEDAELIGERSGQILSVLIIGLGADGAQQLIKRITPEKKDAAEEPAARTPADGTPGSV